LEFKFAPNRLKAEAEVKFTSMNPDFVELPIATNDGTFRAHYSAKGLAGLDSPAQRNGRARSTSSNVSKTILRWHRATTRAVLQILAGRDARNLPPLDWTGKTEFQQAVWREMLKIPAGRTKSYGEVAAAIGKPKAVRAVGGACGANPIPLLVPCHRILAAHKKIGGFSGGLHWKRTLLAREGAAVE
jgi:O-6-methylguanine DNA methyltransferase